MSFEIKIAFMLGICTGLFIALMIALVCTLIIVHRRRP